MKSGFRSLESPTQPARILGSASSFLLQKLRAFDPALPAIIHRWFAGQKTASVGTHQWRNQICTNRS